MTTSRTALTPSSAPPGTIHAEARKILDLETSPRMVLPSFDR